MIQFAKLRLSGFKSFVDRTELEIGPGLNGIVGPNGCGKSNLVEALRWVMGESSAKRMRGDGMDDVIFAGTDKRSARNIAEVSLLLDNTTRKAPSNYNSTDEIEVIRRIERDKGSGYKINGKNARARDVQMLFADTVTGSNSPSLVSQGHVTRMINAKPHDRRLILEESAGIAGLYARRHEAELRLKAADTNLIRVEDIIGSMENRLAALKRQARQASKYKNLSAQIRQLELVITYLEWRVLVDKQKDIRNEFGAAESIVADKMMTVTQLTKTQNTQIEDLPPLRKKEAEAAAKLQKHKLDFQRLEEESTRYKKDLHDTKTQLNQTQVDQQHESQTLDEITRLIERIEGEHNTLQEEQSNDAQYQQEKISKKDELKQSVITLEERFTALKESAAEGRAREEALKNQINSNQNRMNVLQNRKNEAVQKKTNLVIDENSQKMIEELEQKTAEKEAQLHSLNARTDDARKTISVAEDKTDILRQALSAVEKKYAEFSTEIGLLERFFQDTMDHSFKPILGSIVTQHGFEKALSRALGDSLMASIDGDAPAHWKTRIYKDLPALPKGSKPLHQHVNAPQELHLTLSQIGFVPDAETGEKIYTDLKVGQALVSADGMYWRWDGYHVQAHATDHHSVHLEQKNKLIELEGQRQFIEDTLKTAKNNLDESLTAQNNAKQTYSALLLEIKETEQTLRELRPALSKIKEKNLKTQAEFARYEDQIKTLDDDIESLAAVLQKDEIALNVLIENKDTKDNSEDIIATVKEKLDKTKEQYQNAVRDFDIFTQAQNTRRARIQAIADERVSLKNRSIRAKEHLKNLTERAENFAEKLKKLEQNPVNQGHNQEDMLTLITALEKEHADTIERLAACEEEVTVTSKALKEAEQILGNAREERARAQAMMSAINEQLQGMESGIQDSLEMHPKDLVHHAAVDLVKYQAHDLVKLKKEKDQHIRDRDSIGPVNLQAETEASTLEAEVTALLHERNDLLQAIDELRGAINKINKEARERLIIAFEHVNAHFERLFVRLFGGGKAHLKLIDSDDPLGAGLEIFAQPPGKSLQSLSLLSGGEQTLASIALIFGMFLTNPSPICVLDEIDAPLDDANVDRVCDLLDEIAERGETRFLVITHHRLSMARMDRLYGVTMSERGVSQLVSVDLQQSFEFIDQDAA